MLKQWQLTLQGTDLYAGETFRLSVTFSGAYPMQSPEFVFLPPAPVHPHIYTNGHICLDILYDSGPHAAWSPALTIASVCRSLHSMLANAPERALPPGNDAYVASVGSRSSKATQWAFHDDKV